MKTKFREIRDQGKKNISVFKYQNKNVVHKIEIE